MDGASLDTSMEGEAGVDEEEQEAASGAGEDGAAVSSAALATTMSLTSL